MFADVEDKSVWVRNLLNANAFPHSVGQLELIETHISWVVLTGDYAYKIKKPANFDFVDYSDLEKRRRFCELEVELNRRFAAPMYLGVVPILAINGNLKIGNVDSLTSNDENVIEYAVKMKQFPNDAIVAARLQNPKLTKKVVQAFGGYLAQFHQAIESAIPSISFVQPKQIANDALDNFTVAKDYFCGDSRLQKLLRLEAWTIQQLDCLTEKLTKRLLSGKVRRCHGDLHLKNIVQLNGELIAFDGIEFNEKFQWIDVLSEIAFPVVDFIARERGDLGWCLLNSYLETTGDYEDMDVLRFYLVYRALVRVKVTCLHPKNADPAVRKRYSINNASDDLLAGPWDKYLRAATHIAFELQPKLTITHGFSGSGKSTVALSLVSQQGGIRIRSDTERHRLAGIFNARDEYTEAMNDWVHTHLLELAIGCLDAGFQVVIDATFLSLKYRLPFLRAAQERSVSFEILECDAPFEELCDRIRNRNNDPSDATIDVLKKQMETHDPLTTEELSFIRRNDLNNAANP